MKAATYHRLRPDDEEFGDEDLAAWDLLEQLGHTRVGIYHDPVSAVAYRRGLDRLRADAKLYRFEVLVVHQLELLHRSERELAELREELRGSGIEIVSVVAAAAPALAKRKGRKPAEFSLRRARELRATGKSFAAIAAELKVGIATVHRALTVEKRATANAGAPPRVTQDNTHAPDLEIGTAIH